MAATTAQLIDQALHALQPLPSCDKPNQQQIREGDVRAKVALASALNRIAGALEQLAANTATGTSA